MTTLNSTFETDLREALLDDAERKLIGESDNIAHRFAQEAHRRLRAYGREFDMNVEPVIESLEIAAVRRSRNSVSVRLEWTHEAAGFFEYGTSPHTISGNPILSFVWERPPRWVRQEFDQARDTSGRFQSGWRVFFPEVDHPGMPESRAIRNALDWLRREVGR